jgi:PRC-barrel domain protein
MNDDMADLQHDRTPTGDLDAALPGSSVTPLRTLHNYRIAESDPDVRGWDVLAADGRKIGEVDDLLVDMHALKARYLEVTLDLEPLQSVETNPELASAEIPAPPVPPAGTGGLGTAVTETLVRATLSDEENRLTREHHHGSGSRHVLIPIGFARLDPKHDRVLIEGLSAADAAGLPDYHGQRLEPEHEAELRRWFDQTYTHTHDLYDENRFYSSRRGEAIAETARTAGLEAGDATPAGEQDRAITGELDRAVNAPDHSVTRDREEAVLPVRGR